MSASDATRSAGGTGRSRSSSTPATRSINWNGTREAGGVPGRPERGGGGSVPPSSLPSQQRTLRGEAGTEADHEPPLAVHRGLTSKRLLEHEEDRRGGHVAVPTEHGARVRHLRLGELEERPGAVDHASRSEERRVGKESRMRRSR